MPCAFLCIPAFLCINVPACLPCFAPRNAGISTPPVEIVPLGVEVSAQPAVLSVSNKATIPSDHDAIGIDGSFWVGIGQPIETRVISRGNLYLAGSITVEPLAGSAYENISTVAMVGNGMVGGARFVAPAHVMTGRPGHHRLQMLATTFLVLSFKPHNYQAELSSPGHRSQPQTHTYSQPPHKPAADRAVLGPCAWPVRQV
jgi:hypothetical protein